MALRKPSAVRRSFERSSAIVNKHIPVPKPSRNKRIQRTNHWPGAKLNYEFLEKCKEFVCRIKHPTAFYKHQDSEYRLAIMRWSRGSYIDIRLYSKGTPRPMGILLHLDVVSAMLPDLIAAVRQLQVEDDREEDKKANVEVISGEATRNI